MKKLSRKIVCIFSSTVLFCGATGMTADAETNRITFESNLTELNTSLKYGNKLNPDLNLSEMLEARGNNYNKIPNGIFEPVEGKIDLSLKATLKHSDLTLTPNEIAEGKKVTLEVQTQNAALYRNYGTIKYQWFGPKGLISNANSRTYETNDIGSYYCYVWIDYDFYSNDDNANILNLPDDSNAYVPFFRPQLVRPSGLIWKVPEGAVKTNTATVRLIDDLVIEQQPMNMPIYDFEKGGIDYGAELSVSVTGGSGKYNYAWYNINSSEPIGFNRKFITYDTGKYYCVISDEQGRTIKTNTAESIGEYLYCNNKDNNSIRTDNDGVYRNMEVNISAGILEDENIKTEFLVEWEEAGLYEDNWKIIERITSDKSVFTKEMYLHRYKRYRYQAYVIVNGRKSGQVTSGITTIYRI